MDIRDSQRIKEIRDNTAKIADAFTRIADALERLTDQSDSEKPNNCEDEPQWWLTENSLDDFRSGFVHGYAQAKHEYEPKLDPNDCETCKHDKLAWYSEVCDGCSKAHSNYEPKTEQNNCKTCDQLGRCDRGRAVDCPITESRYRCPE